MRAAPGHGSQEVRSVLSPFEGVVMRIRILLAAAATLALAACADSVTPSSPLTPGTRSSDGDITCRSGYHVATRSDGSQYCEADAFARATTAP